MMLKKNGAGRYPLYFRDITIPFDLIIKVQVVYIRRHNIIFTIESWNSTGILSSDDYDITF